MLFRSPEYSPGPTVLPPWSAMLGLSMRAREYEKKIKGLRAKTRERDRVERESRERE